MAQALIPLKDLTLAKTRLAGLLAPGERRTLARAMLEDVLGVLCAHPAVERVTLLSDDPGASDLCRIHGIDFLREGELGVRGLNPALQAAASALAPARDDSLLVLHADLPLLEPGDISAACALHAERGGLVIGGDRHGRGTNLLLCGASRVPEFRFGADSFKRHCDWARTAGVACSVLARRGTGFDVDEADDLRELLSMATGERARHTLQALADSNLSARLQPAPASAAGKQLGAGFGG